MPPGITFSLYIVTWIVWYVHISWFLHFLVSFWLSSWFNLIDLIYMRPSTFKLRFQNINQCNIQCIHQYYVRCFLEEAIKWDGLQNTVQCLMSCFKFVISLKGLKNGTFYKKKLLMICWYDVKFINVILDKLKVWWWKIVDLTWYDIKYFHVYFTAYSFICLFII